MLHSALRWIIPLATLLVLGPLAGLLTASLHAPDGGRHVTILLNDAPVLGVLAAGGAVLLATLAGSISARLHGAGAGLFCAGLVLAWAAWGTGDVDQILRRTQSGSIFWTLAVEGAIVGLLACLGAAVIAAVARKPEAPPSEPRPAGVHRGPAELSFILGVVEGVMLQVRNITGRRDDDEGSGVGAMLVALALAVGAAAIGAWLVAQESLKGQTFAAAVVAGILAAGIGHAGDQRARVTLYFAAMALLAVAVPIAAAVSYASAADAVRAAYASSLLAPARILPMDWIAGAFVGIPIGLNWAGSMLEKHPEGG